MKIKSLKLKNFRNYPYLQLALDASTNIFYGDNAQGKTNILEAVYLSGTTKSHRGAKDKDMIRFGEEEAHIETLVEKRGVNYQIDVHLKKNHSKGIAVNHMPIKKASDLFGIMNLVFFSPEDLSIIKAGPHARRRFLDLELSQLDRIYLTDLSRYNQAVNQRNVLLKSADGTGDQADLLDVWETQMVQYGEAIIKRRQAFVEEINGLLNETHQKLTGGKEDLTLVYEPSNGEVDLKQALEKNREKDRRMKNTSVGPHRDDLCFLSGGLDLRRFGSQGQQRSAALSLKLSEIELVKKAIHDTPILLLDDVLSELDEHRQTCLLASIHDVQTLLTCTGVDEFVNHRFSINKVFHVQNGQARNEN